MQLLIALAALAAQPAPVLTPSQAPAAGSRFGELFVDWGTVNREAIQQELERAAATPHRSEHDARTLGDRVGETVAAGDCEGGERMAREARDFALVRAVQEHCRRGPVSELPAWARPG